MRVPTMLVASILVGVGLLAGCSTIPLTTAASMRVEVEVYKGPLSKTVPVQWGELEGLVDVAVESLEVFGDAVCKAIAVKYACTAECNSKDPSDSIDESSIQTCSAKFMSCATWQRQTKKKNCSRDSVIGYNILSRMHGDAEELQSDLKVLHSAVKRHNRRELDCHVGELASCDRRPPNECGAAATGELAAGMTRTCLETARGAARVILERDQEIRTAAATSGSSVKAARASTAAASEYMNRLNRIADANAFAHRLEKLLTTAFEDFMDIRDSIADVKAKTDLLNPSQLGAVEPGDVMTALESALDDTQRLVDRVRKALTDRRSTSSDLVDALGNIDDPAAKVIADAATELSRDISASVSSIGSAMASVVEGVDDVRKALEAQVALPGPQPLVELRAHLARARDHAGRLNDQPPADPIQPMIEDLTTAASKVRKILAMENDDKTVREVAGLQEGETELTTVITGRIQTRLEDVGMLRGLKYDDLEAIHLSLTRASGSASALAFAGVQEKLTELTVELNRIIEQTQRMRPAPDSQELDRYADSLKEAAETLRAGPPTGRRVQLDGMVKDNRGPLAELANALDKAVTHLGAVVSAPRVPSTETRTQLHADLGELVALAKDPKLRSFREVKGELRAPATRLSSLLERAASEAERHRAEVSRQRDSLVGIEQGLDLLLAQVRSQRTALGEAVMKLEDAETKTNELSSATGGVRDSMLEAASRENVVEQAGRVAAKLKAKGFYWAETHTGLAPSDRYVRIAMAAFTNLVSELSNQIESRADALQWQLDEDGGINARELPLSMYLRDAEPTDFLNLYTWNRAAAPALFEDMLLHPLDAFSSDETADRVRVIERLFADHNWGRINTVYGSGQGKFAMALVKDEVGNWNLKSFESDPSELVDAYKDLTLAAINKMRKALSGQKLPTADLLHLTGNLARGQVGGDSGRFDVSDAERLHARVLEEIEAIGVRAATTQEGLANKHADAKQEADRSAVDARAAKEKAESAELLGHASTCTAEDSCTTEVTRDKAEGARTEAFKAEIRVQDMSEGVAASAASVTALANKAVEHARDAETKAAMVTSPADSAAIANAARLSAERAEAYARAATAGAALAGALVDRDRVAAAIAEHRVAVIAQIRDVLNDHAAVIGMLLELESRASSRSSSKNGSAQSRGTSAPD